MSCPRFGPWCTSSNAWTLPAGAAAALPRRRCPPGVPKGQYDPSVQAMIARLRGELRQSVRQTSAVMTKLMHVPISSAMVAKTQQKSVRR